jgi:hypothetical protein
MSYCNSTCNQNSSTGSSSSKSSNTQQQQQQQCGTTLQLITQAIHLMGPFFPLSKKLSLNQIQAVLNKQPKMMFNMYLPVVFTSHTHQNGAILLQPHTPNNTSDYEKSLIESYIPYLSFFDWLCQTSLTLKRVNASGATSSSASTSSGQETGINTQSMKHLIDLILFTSQQFILINIHFISHLNNFLASICEATTNPTGNNASPNTSSSAILLSQSFLNNSEFFNMIAESPYLHSFVNSVLTDFRHSLAKKDFYDFFAIVLQRFILNLINNNESSLTTMSQKNSSNNPTTSNNGNEEKISTSSSSSNKSNSTLNTAPSPILLVIKSFIERCCHSINEIRFYFEFQQVSKHLITVVLSKKGESNLIN